MKRPFAVLLLAVSLSACSSMPDLPDLPDLPSMPFSDRTQSLEVGMTQRQVEGVLGKNYKIVGSRYSADGQPMTVWSYQKSKEDQEYWIFIKGGRLVQWGTPASIQEIPDVKTMDLPKPAPRPA